MKTIVIWDTCGAENIKFFVVDGNKSHWDNVYINSMYENPNSRKVHDELLEFMFPSALEGNENESIQWLDTFPYNQFRAGGTLVVVAGFLP